MARRAKLERSLKIFERRVATHRFGGIELKVSLCDPVGEEWYDHDSGTLAEITFFRESGALNDGATVFDLGAHQAVVALQLATHVGPTGRVVALEANPHNARVAAENVALNDKRNLTILHAAAASEDGMLEFNESLNGQVDGGAGTHGKVQVKSRSIDSLAREFGTPDIVYVDVEGFECAVLDGAGASFGRIPNWFVEVHGGAGLEKFGGSVDRLLGYFPADRFKRHFCRSDEGPFIPLSETGSLEGTRWFFIATRI
ncbi:FkbM family methyltransferase [Methylobacterium terrae]|nr:FkbM family methyltransferase [Methylobacterium terrae]